MDGTEDSLDSTVGNLREDSKLEEEKNRGGESGTR